MLAASGAGKLQGEWAAEPKLDGWRTIVTIDPSLPSGIEVRLATWNADTLADFLARSHGYGDRYFAAWHY